jgi:hypothetical protein
MKWHSIAIGSAFAVVIITAYIILSNSGISRTEGYSNLILPYIMEDPQPTQVVSTGCFTRYNDCSMLNDCCREHAITHPQDAIHATDCSMWARAQSENPNSYLSWVNWGSTLLGIPSNCRYNATPIE